MKKTMSFDWANHRAKQCELLTKKWFSTLGEVEKIPDRKGGYDFKIDKCKLLIEVTWINSEKRATKRTDRLYEIKPLTDDDFYYKIQDKVVHLEKDRTEHSGYRYGGIIFWDTLFDFIQHPLTHKNFTESFPFDYGIMEYDWEYLVLCEEPSIGDRPPAIIYIRNGELVDLLNTVFSGQDSITYVLNNDHLSSFNLL